MFTGLKAKAGQLGVAASNKVNGIQGRMAGTVIALAASSSAMAEGETATVSPMLSRVTGQVTTDVNFLTEWGTEIFIVIFGAGLLWKMTRKVGNKATG